MADNFRGLIVSILIVSIFAVATISFGATLISDNDGNSSFINNPTVNSLISNLSEDLNETSDIAANSSDSFNSDEATAGIGDILFPSILDTLRKLKNTPKLLYNVLMTPLATIIGIDPFILGALATIIVIISLLLAWRALKSGD